MLMRITVLALLASTFVASVALAQPAHPAAPPTADTLVLALSTDSITAGRVDAVVRAHGREVQFCFEESGLKVDPELSGIFAMILTIDTLGVVTRVDPSRREWTGTDGLAVEACVMQRAREWKFPHWLALAPSRHEVSFHFAR
jgi:hypothetical protein